MKYVLYQQIVKHQLATLLSCTVHSLLSVCDAQASLHTAFVTSRRLVGLRVRSTEVLVRFKKRSPMIGFTRHKKPQSPRWMCGLLPTVWRHSRSSCSKHLILMWMALNCSWLKAWSISFRWENVTKCVICSIDMSEKFAVIVSADICSKSGISCSHCAIC